jgi:hypothetical protein
MCRSGGAVADCCRDCMTFGQIKLLVSTPDHCREQIAANEICPVCQEPSAGHHIAARRIVRDEQDEIVAQLKAWIVDPTIDVVISTPTPQTTASDGGSGAL